MRKTYEDMREKHGFRILDYKVDNESAKPRVCFNFSEPLARKTDFAPYVAVAGASNAAISTEEQQICVEGLKHGERYAIVAARGPALVGRRDPAEDRPITRSTCGTVRRRRISPARAYVLPRQGQLGAPLTTVNTAKVVGRRLSRRRPQPHERDRARRFPEADIRVRASEIEIQDGAKVWSGAMDVASELNKDVVTDFPLARGGRQAAARRLSRHRASVEGAPAASGGENYEGGDDSSRRNGWSSPTSG